MAGFTLIELLIVMVLMAVMSGMAVLAMGNADGGRSLQLEADRLLKLLELAEQEASLRGEVIGVELYAGGYRFLHIENNAWQMIVDDDLFRSRSLPVALALTLSLDGAVKPLSNSPGYQPQPQIVLTADGDSADFRIALSAADSDERYWIDNGGSGLQLQTDRPGQGQPL